MLCSIDSVATQEEVNGRLHSPIGRSVIRVPREPALHVGQALAHRCKVFGGLQRIVDLQLALLMLTLEQPGEGKMHSPGSGIEEALAKLRLQFDLGCNALLEPDHFGAGQEGHHRSAKGEQPVANGATVVVEQQLTTDILALMLDGGGEQAPLVAEVAVDRHLGDPGVRGDRLDAGSGIAVVEEGPLGGEQYLLALAQVRRAAPSGLWYS